MRYGNRWREARLLANLRQQNADLLAQSGGDEQGDDATCLRKIADSLQSGALPAEVWAVLNSKYKV